MPTGNDPTQKLYAKLTCFVEKEKATQDVLISQQTFHEVLRSQMPKK